MENYLQPMIDSAVRMSLEALKLQQQMQLLAITRQIQLLQEQISWLERALTGQARN